jgi:hypothetical protein
LKTTVEEVEAAIAKLKNNKAGGEDTITTELIKYGGQIIPRRIHKFINTTDMTARNNAT